MGSYTEVKKGQSGAVAETEEVDLRQATQLVIVPKDDGVEVTEHFKTHKPETIEFAKNEGQELMDYLESCLLADEEQGDEEKED